MRARHDKRLRFIVLGVFVATFSFAFLLNKNDQETADAADLSKFNPGNIISDYMMSDYNSMTEAEIQSFLTSKNSCKNTDYSYYQYLTNLNGEIWHWKDNHFVCISEEKFGEGTDLGEGETAAHIIYNAAQTHKINPQVLLVLLEKETGLISDPIPNFYDYRKAVGYGCYDSETTCRSEFYGFKNQINRAAKLFREVLDGGWTNYPLGDNYVQYSPDTSCGGTIVNIQNLATSSLYRYTPYQPNSASLAAGYGQGDYCSSYGNRNFYQMFYDWFGDPTTSNSPTSFLVNDGSYYIKTTSGKNLSVENGQAHISSDKYLFEVARLNDGFYTLKNSNGQFLVSKSASNNEGEPISLEKNFKNTCSNKWEIVFKDGLYAIKSACNREYVFDIANGAINTEKASVRLWSNNESIAQYWDFQIKDNIAAWKNEDYYTLTATSNMAITSSNMGNVYIDKNNELFSQQITFSMNEDGTYMITNKNNLILQSNPDHNSISFVDEISSKKCSQRWIIKQNGVYYTIQSLCDNKALDIFNGAINTKGSVVQLWDFNNTQAQKWLINKVNGANIQDGIYSITSRINSRYVVDVSGGSTKNGANIQLFNSNNSEAQKFNFIYHEDGNYYTILNIKSKKEVGLSYEKVKNGDNVQQWDEIDSCTKKWKIIKRNDGYYEIESYCNREYLLDAQGGRAADGTNIQIYRKNNTVSQQWLISADVESEEEPSILKDGAYIIKSKVNQAFSVDVTGAGKANGANIQLYENNGTDAQKFYFEYDSDSGYYTIKNINSKKNIDLDNASVQNGTNIKQWEANNSCAQNWILVNDDDGSYEILSACSKDYAIDLSGGNARNGSNIQLYQRNWTNSQKWIISNI